MEISIYTCHHKESAFLADSVFCPIHVGKANSYNDIGCRGDDTGCNISLKNPYYCELTAQYWIWKNDLTSDYVGLMHYRRHLSFSEPDGFRRDQWGVIVEEELDEAYQAKHGLNRDAVLEKLGNCDVILPEKWDVRNAGSKNNYEHYGNSPDLFISDYQEAVNALLKQHPDFYDAVKEYNGSPLGYYTNMFVMKRDIFDDYSRWLFDILDELEDKLSLQGYNQQQSRVFGHISERLLGIYFTKKRNEGLNIKEVGRTFLSKEGFNGGVVPWYGENNHPVVICFDDNYSHSGGALLNSIKNNANPDKNYDILVLENGVSNRNKARLKSLFDGCDNFNIRFFNINAFDEIKDVHTRAHFSPATYARLFIPQVFKEQEKVLFIDADTVVNDDIANLFDVDLEDNLVAAVKDIVMEGFVKFKAISDHHTGALEARDYLTDYLGLKDGVGYFQAGLIMFNLDKMREEGTFDHLMEALRLKPYWFLDQDIMNKVFEGRVRYLPLSWNVFHGNGNTFDFFPGLNFSTFSEFLEARKNPSMVHYAGDQKPWNNPSVDFSDMYWNALRGTPWYEERVSNLVTGKLHDKKVVHEVPKKSLSKEERFRSFLKPFFNKAFPHGSRGRMVLSKFYFRSLYVYRKAKFWFSGKAFR
ncbi:DUF4422 domain-containing protein [Halomonas elongata]|uniref:DUF4422 domain-containing protein n=1 Tax=Halomonas elongata TaxID=2746 RepID=UPI00255B3BF6|nr:DUF4422 domain-containing protein [Halomonas elongata]MDL4862240.1 DUF4422 domain-containing protein [Halomonas elongata]